MRGSLASPIVTDWSAYASNFLLPNLPFDSVDWNCRTAHRQRADRLAPRNLPVTFSLLARLALRVDLAEEKFYGSTAENLCDSPGDFASRRLSN